MSEKEKQVLGNLEKMIPNMTESEMARLVGYGEGLAAREDRAGEEPGDIGSFGGHVDAE